MHPLPYEIFKAYDIRGIVGQNLTPAGMERIGLGLGSMARDLGQTHMVLGRDGRLSGPELAAALTRGLCATGMQVMDLGRITTPMAYFAAIHLGCRCAAMVTGSHNPPAYNGLKMVLAGETLSGTAIQALRQRIEVGDFQRGEGTHRRHDIGPAYQARITGDIHLTRPMQIAVDAGNGVAGAFAPALFRALGCEVGELFCEVDGHFPNHHPDPSIPANLRALSQHLQAGDAELGLAFDGDGDRLGVVTRDGGLIFPDRLLMLFAADVLSRHPGGQIIFDVKSSRNLYKWIRDHGGEPMLWKTGHSVLKTKLRETGALLAGELSGHIFFKERWYGFDDGLYAGARLLEILSRHKDASAVLRALPNAMSTPELQIRMGEGEPHELMERLRREARFEGAEDVITLDGLRVEYKDGFGLLRASNTIPALVLRFEADDAAALTRIQGEFRQLLQQALPGWPLPF